MACLRFRQPGRPIFLPDALLTRCRAVTCWGQRWGEAPGNREVGERTTFLFVTPLFRMHKPLPGVPEVAAGLEAAGRGGGGPGPTLTTEEETGEAVAPWALAWHQLPPFSPGLSSPHPVPWPEMEERERALPPQTTNGKKEGQAANRCTGTLPC